MKIKEVTQQTGLTDKAIRLYIENGLVSPGISEDYNGRKKIDFSQADIDRLRNVAVLRKAGFSINSIKQILSGGEAAEEAVESFIREAKEQINQQSDTLSILENSDFELGITFESLSNALLYSSAEKNVPQEDMEPSLGERVLRQLFSIIGLIGTVLCLIPAGWLIWNWLNYKHIKFDIGMIEAVLIGDLCWVVLAVLWFNLYRGNTENSFFRSKKKLAIKSNIVRLVALIAAVPVAFFFFCIGALVFDGNIRCETHNPEHYLDFYKTSNWLYSEAIEIFPHEIPKRAENVEYYYSLDGDYYDVFAEYSFTQNEKEEYIKTKAKVIEKTLSLRTYSAYNRNYDTGEILSTELKYEITEIKPVINGDWVCYFLFGGNFEYSEDKNVIHQYLVFAYNDKTQTVRYILSKGTVPYLYKIEW